MTTSNSGSKPAPSRSSKARSGRSAAQDSGLDLSHLLAHHEHGSTTDAVTDALREAILTGLLQPQQWLREDELARALAVSRTPVRDALRRLSDEGLAQHSANRGTVVAPMGLDEILSVYAVRTHLEGLAARLAAGLRPPGLISELLEIHREMSQATQAGSTDLSAINLRFHRAIRDATQNSYLQRFLYQIENAVRRCGETTFAEPGRPQEVLDEHAAIIEAIAAGDAGLAEAHATAHMRTAREVRLRQMIGAAQL